MADLSSYQQVCRLNPVLIWVWRMYKLLLIHLFAFLLSDLMPKLGDLIFFPFAMPDGKVSFIWFAIQFHILSDVQLSLTP